MGGVSERHETDADERRHLLDRLEILDAIMLALERREQMWSIVEAAPDADRARGDLMAALGLTEVQATAVMDLQVRRFSARERSRIAEERDSLRALAAGSD